MRAPTEARVRFVDVSAQTRSLEPSISRAINAVVQRGDFILGEDVERFEAEFAAYCGVKYAVGLDSGISALELALRAGNIGPGDEVITQANTFIATVGAIMATGARPVLTDCDADGAINPELVKGAVTSRTRAIIPVHLFGRIGDIDAILDIGEGAQAAVIEDACQAHGAILGGQRAGSFGDSAAFSFYPAKNLGAFGDGGMMVTSSDEIASEVRELRNYGQKAKYEHSRFPLNRRLDTIQAAVLRVKLPHLDAWNKRRQYLAEMYRERLAGLPLKLAAPVQDGRHVYHLFVIEVDERDRLRNALSAEGIETGIHYPIPLHQQRALSALGFLVGAFPNSERLATTSLSLPMYPELPDEHLERVAAAIRRHLTG